ncbi:AraC family transcriptional regulator [Catenulispora yoronensis]|uniref:AraC family transcriptional regulator n=1 Tax=Catenulispora yoronensis TaxID=450799 RepID=A0ABP5FTX6_9ACTN
MEGTRGWAEYWRDEGRGLELMHARFREHVYAPHTHDAYSFGVTDAGAQQFHCRGALHTSTPGMVMALNPDEVHDGRAAVDLGYHYRIAYIRPDVVSEVLADAADQPADRFGGLPLFTRPVLGDHRLAEAFNRFHAAMAGADRSPAGDLLRDERLRAVILAAAARGATRAPKTRTLSGGAQRQAAVRARTLIREAYPESVSVEMLAAAAGCSRFALYRAFFAEFGMSPSDYERQLRLRHARSLLATGNKPADTAALCGFADQAHLARWFKRTYGVTPGVFAQAAVSSPPGRASSPARPSIPAPLTTTS